MTELDKKIRNCYFVTIVFALIFLLEFILDFFFHIHENFIVRMISVSLLTLLAIYYFIITLLFIKHDFSLSHLIVPLGYLMWTIVLTFLVAHISAPEYVTRGLSHEATKLLSDILEVLLYSFMIVYSYMVLKGKSESKNRLTRKQPVRSIIIWCFIITFLIMFGQMIMIIRSPISLLAIILLPLSIPGYLLSHTIGNCPSTDVPQFEFFTCDLSYFLVSALIIGSLLGLIIGIFRKRE